MTRAGCGRADTRAARVCQRWFLVQGQIKSIGAAAVTHIKDDSSSTALVVASKAPAKEAPAVRNSAPYAIRSLLLSAETCRAWMLSGFCCWMGGAARAAPAPASAAATPSHPRAHRLPRLPRPRSNRRRRRRRPKPRRRRRRRRRRLGCGPPFPPRHAIAVLVSASDGGSDTLVPCRVVSDGGVAQQVARGGRRVHC